MAEIVHSVEFQMSLLLFLALAGYILAARINQSAVIGEILVGLLIGPGVLGFITYTDFVDSLANLGAAILLFVVGLEFRLEDIAKPRFLAIAAGGVVVPWVLGYLTSALFGFSFNSSVFIGVAITATSIAITAKVLKEMGRLDSAAAHAIIGAAVIDDILSLLALAVGQGLADGSMSLLALALVPGKAFLFLVAGALIGRFVLRKLMTAIDGTRFIRAYPEFTFIFAMMLAFLYGMAADLLGLSAIVGSFLAGASLAGLRLKHSKDMKEGADYLQAIFASVFFVSLGILADIRALDPRILLFICTLCVVAVASKLIGCGGTARVLGYSLRESAVIGFGMTPRGEVAMIVALIGLDRGMIGQDVYVSIILMSFITTVLTPIVLKNWLIKKDEKRKGRADEASV